MWPNLCSLSQPLGDGAYHPSSMASLMGYHESFWSDRHLFQKPVSSIKTNAITSQICGFLSVLLDIFIKRKKNTNAVVSSRGESPCSLLSPPWWRSPGQFRLRSAFPQNEFDDLVRDKNWVLSMLALSMPDTYSRHWNVCGIVSMVLSSRKTSTSLWLYS